MEEGKHRGESLFDENPFSLYQTHYCEGNLFLAREDLPLDISYAVAVELLSFPGEVNPEV